VDIFVDQLFFFLQAVVRDVAQGFFFDLSEEVLHRGVVPAISSTKHGGSDVILLGKDSIRLRGVLIPLATVEDQSISDLFFFLSQLNSAGDQGHRVGKAERLGYDEPAKQVLDGGQVSPALPGSDVSDIGDTLLIRSRSHKIAVQHVIIAMIDGQLAYFGSGFFAV